MPFSLVTMLVFRAFNTLDSHQFSLFNHYSRLLLKIVSFRMCSHAEVLKWQNLSVYFRHPEPSQKVIYPTNSIEAIHRPFRKLTNTKGTAQLPILSKATPPIARRASFAPHSHKTHHHTFSYNHSVETFVSGNIEPL